MTGGAAVERDIFEELRRIPLIDAHTHLVGGRLGARGLHDILLYHMSVSDLYTAGCPTGARLTEYPGWPDRRAIRARRGAFGFSYPIFMDGMSR